MGNRTIGQYIITDIKICHGQPVFRDTRILVADVLEQAASDMAWKAIIEEWRGVKHRADSRTFFYEFSKIIWYTLE